MPAERSTGGQPLLDAVLADPDDVDARLVYADWLTEHGDPRGEFIHVQCALGRPLVNASGRAWARPTFEGDPKELEKRERKLLAEHQKTWVAPFRATVRTWNWSCGFVDRVVADCAAFLAGAHGLFAETPVTAAKLTAIKPPMIHTLAEQPTSAKLRGLDINFQKLDAAGVAAFHAETWRGLRVLDLSGNQLGVEGLRVLGASRTLVALRDLRLADARLTDDATAELARAPLFANLEALDLGYNAELSSASAKAIAATGRSLVKLRLRSTAITAADLAFLVGALPRLAELDLGPGWENQVTAALARRA